MLHAEVWQAEPRVIIDEMVHFVASSLEKAEEYMKKVYIFSDAYWIVNQFVLDGKEDAEGWIVDWPDSISYYGNKGRKLKRPPFQRAVRAFLRENPKGFKE